ncbi:MAG: LPS export ABC transporter periplasmic protein LptC [Saprospiraceae bacterium]|nr:LPS export ABC transporter periplasmic protein LptC [Saprospiraceae bacterium]
MKYLCAIIISYLFISSCTNEMTDIERIIPDSNIKIEKARNIEMIYSDSGMVRVIVKGPEMNRYTHQGESYDEFPAGLVVEFLDNYQRPKSWLEADYALRKDAESKIIVKENVVLYNKRNEKLETDELVWDEIEEELYTNKLVKITQPALGDTSIGFGFRADQEFTRFEIKKRFSGIKNIEEYTKDIK